MSDLNSLESLFRLVHAIKHQMQHQAEQLDLGIAPMHIRVIKIINRQKSCTANDIAKVLSRDKAQITRLINTLMDKKLIIKLPNPQDQRSHYLQISTAGSNIIQQISQLEAATVQIMTENITAEAVNEFQDTAQHMTQNLSAELKKKHQQ